MLLSKSRNEADKRTAALAVQGSTESDTSLVHAESLGCSSKGIVWMLSELKNALQRGESGRRAGPFASQSL